MIAGHSRRCLCVLPGTMMLLLAAFSWEAIYRLERMILMATGLRLDNGYISILYGGGDHPPIIRAGPAAFTIG